MSIEDFAEITQPVIRKDGFDGFMPTLCLPEREQVTVLEGVPEEKQSGMRSNSLAFARRKANQQEEFLLAFREGETSFCIIPSFGGEIREKVFPVV